MTGSRPGGKVPSIESRRGDQLNLDVGAVLVDAGLVVVMLLGLVAPLIVLVLLLWLAVRHLQGKRSPLDGLFNGIGRANAMNSHVQAGTPHPDDLAVPVPPAPGPGRRVRRRRR